MGKNFKYQLGCGCACSTSQETVPFCNENNNEPCVLLEDASSSEVWTCINEQLVKHFNKECPAKLLICDATPQTTYPRKNTNELDSLIGEDSYIIIGQDSTSTTEIDDLSLTFSDVFYNSMSSLSSVPVSSGIRNNKMIRTTHNGITYYYDDRETITVYSESSSKTSSSIIFPIENTETQAQTIYNLAQEYISLNENSSYWLIRCSCDLGYVSLNFWFPKQVFTYNTIFASDIDEDLTFATNSSLPNDSSLTRYSVRAITSNFLPSKYLTFSINNDSTIFQLYSVQISGDDVTEKYLIQEKISVKKDELSFFYNIVDDNDSSNRETSHWKNNGTSVPTESYQCLYPFTKATGNSATPWESSLSYVNVFEKEYPVTNEYSATGATTEILEQSQNAIELFKESEFSITGEVTFTADVDNICNKDTYVACRYTSTLNDTTGIQTYNFECKTGKDTTSTNSYNNKPYFTDYDTNGRSGVAITPIFVFALNKNKNFLLSSTVQASYALFTYDRTITPTSIVEDGENYICSCSNAVYYAENITESSVYTDSYEIQDSISFTLKTTFTIPKTDFNYYLKQAYQNLKSAVLQYEFGFNFRMAENMQGYIPYELHEPTDEDSYFTDFTLCEG